MSPHIDAFIDMNFDDWDIISDPEFSTNLIDSVFGQFGATGIDVPYCHMIAPRTDFVPFLFGSAIEWRQQYFPLSTKACLRFFGEKAPDENRATERDDHFFSIAA